MLWIPLFSLSAAMIQNILDKKATQLQLVIAYK